MKGLTGIKEQDREILKQVDDSVLNETDNYLDEIRNMILEEHYRRQYEKEKKTWEELDKEAHLRLLLPDDVHIVKITDKTYDSGCCRGIERHFYIELYKKNSTPLYFEYEIITNHGRIDYKWDFRKPGGYYSFIIYVIEGHRASFKTNSKYLYKCAGMNGWVDTFDLIKNKSNMHFTDEEIHLFNQLIPTMEYIFPAWESKLN